MTNLSTNLVVSARNHPDKTALRCGEDTLSFAEFDAPQRGWRPCSSGPGSTPVTGSG